MSVKQILHFWRFVFLINIYVFHHLKLAIQLQMTNNGNKQFISAGVYNVSTASMHHANISGNGGGGGVCLGIKCVFKQDLHIFGINLNTFE